MRIADQWSDYELLDCSEGQKLERWDTVILARPDPQVIWNTPKGSIWKQADAVYHRSATGGGHWEEKRPLKKQWSVNYHELKFKISPTGFKHTGLFPEQAVNWDWAQKKIRESGRPIKVLNLFAYTGGATLACASAGASVCHVDASKGMVSWARENAALSGLSDRPIRWIVDDCLKFAQREIRRGVQYDAIIMDPPSYGRGSGGEVWKLEEMIYDLVSVCCQLFSDQPLFFMINSYTTGLSPSVMQYILGSLMQQKYSGQLMADEIGLPVTKSGFVLPCGGTAVWHCR